MRWLERITQRRASPSVLPAHGQACRSCAHFDGAPAAVEAAFPNLSAMSSGYAAVRASDGLCRLRDIYLSGGASCADHLERSHRDAGALLAGLGTSAI